EDVVSDEKFARSNDGRPGSGMHARFADIRPACGIRGDIRPDSFELTAADIFQALAFRNSRGRLVEIHGNLIALPDLFADMVGHGDAVFYGDAVNRNEWHDVGGSHSRMRTGVNVEVDQLGGFAHAANRG